MLAVVTPETKIDTATIPEKNSSIDTSDIRKLTEELDWKTYHNDSVDGMKIISFFARSENDSTEMMEIKVERKTTTENQEDISFSMPASVKTKNGIMLMFLIIFSIVTLIVIIYISVSCTIINIINHCNMLNGIIYM